MDGTLFANLLMAATIGVTAAIIIIGALAILFARDLFARCWAKITKPLGVSLVVGYAVLAMAAVTQTDLTTQVKNILPSANGGTGIAYFLAAGPTAVRTYAFPDANATVLTGNAAVTVPQGGTGVTSLTAHGVVLGEGTSNAAISAAGGASTCFMGNGASSDPTFQTCPSAANQNQGAPSGSINGSNTTFTLSPTPAASSNVNCFLNGVQQQQGAGDDYTISGATITYLTAPPTGAKLNCLWY